MIYMLDLEDVVGFMNNALRGLFGYLCQFIYPLIGKMYTLFKNMGEIVYADGFKTLYDKISLIIGIFMVFRIIFWLIELVVNPDGVKDKEKNPYNIIKKTFISVILLAMTPTLFEYANLLQTKILNSQIIEKIFSIEAISDSEETGKHLTAELFMNFYTPNEDALEDECKKHAEKNDASVIYTGLRYSDKMPELTKTCLTQQDKKGEYVINFNGIFATAVGGFVLWMLLMYCIEVGVRFVQLIYLQVIAPIPIMCYVVPGKDNMFTKWLKQCTTTYLDLFIRMAIINFVMLMCNLILSNEANFIQTFSNDDWIIEVFLVLGLLTFAKKAPALISELIPTGASKASGDFGLSLKKRTDNMIGGKFMYNTAKRAPGYAIGGAIGGAVGGFMGAMGGKGVGSRIMGALTGAGRGFGTGSKKGNVIKNLGDVKKNQAAQNRKLEQWRIAAGKGENDANKIGDWWARTTTGAKAAMGFDTDAVKSKRIADEARKVHSQTKNDRDWYAKKGEEKNSVVTVTDAQTGAKVTRGIAMLKADYDRKKMIYDTLDSTRLSAEGRKALSDAYTGSSPAEQIQNQENKKFDIMREYYMRAKGMNDTDAAAAADEYVNGSVSHTDEEIVRAYVETQESIAQADMLNAKKMYEDGQDEAGFVEMFRRLGEADTREKAQITIKRLNEFIKENDELLHLTKGGKDADGHDVSALLPADFKEFKEEDFSDPTKRADMLKAWKALKGLDTRIDSFEGTKKYQTDQATDSFNGSN